MSCMTMTLLRRREHRAQHPEEAKEARDALISVYLTLVRTSSR